MARGIGKKKLDIIFDCWKSHKTYGDRLAAVQGQISDMSPTEIIKVMRDNAASNPIWKTWEKQQQDKIKSEAIMKEERKKELLQNRERRKKKSKRNEAVSFLQQHLMLEDAPKVQDKLQDIIFFCNKTNQYSNKVSCIYRIFSADGEFVPGSVCSRCLKMDKYLDLVKEIVNDRKVS